MHSAEDRALEEAYVPGELLKPTIELSELTPNAFEVLSKTREALEADGATMEALGGYMTEAMSGDYDHLMAVTAQYVTILVPVETVYRER